MNEVAIVGTGQTKFSKENEDIEKILFAMAPDEYFQNEYSNAD